MAGKYNIQILPMEIYGNPVEVMKFAVLAIKKVDFLEFPLGGDLCILVDHHRSGGFRVRRRDYTNKPITLDEAIVPSPRAAAIKASEYAGLS